MAVVPAISARDPAAHPPLTFEAPLAYEDRLAGSLYNQWPRLNRQRRRILTVGLPLMWFLACLGMVSAWSTAGGRRDLGTLMRDLPRFELLPLGLCLAVITASLLVSWAVFPARMRRQMRTTMGPRGRDGPVVVRYHLDSAGITQTLPGLTSFVPWSLIRGLGEDRRHLFLMTALGEEPIAIRKESLAVEVAEGVRRWVGDCAGRAVSPPDPASVPLETGSVRVGVDLTVDDRAVLIERALTTPVARRARLVGAAGWFVVLSLIYPMLTAALWCIDPYRVPFEIAFPLFVEMIGTDFWQPAAIALVFVVLALAMNRIFRRPAVRSLAEAITAEAPQEEAEARIGEDGIVAIRGSAQASIAWSLFRGCERTGDLLILPMRWGSVLPLPLRAFDPEGLARFEALRTRHLSGTGDTT